MKAQRSERLDWNDLVKQAFEQEQKVTGEVGWAQEELDFQMPGQRGILPSAGFRFLSGIASTA